MMKSFLIINQIIMINKYLIYLMYERMTNLSLYQRSKSKFVRIDSYIIKETNVQYISSWFFNVSFPFLPVNRLVADLFLVNESFKIYIVKNDVVHMENVCII